MEPSDQNNQQNKSENRPTTSRKQAVDPPPGTPGGRPLTPQERWDRVQVDYGHLVKFFIVLLLMIGIAFGGLAGWGVYRDRQAAKEIDRQQQLYQELEDRYIEAMTNDTHGGTTPRETLDLFVEALRAGDMELASKYFALDHETLSRDKWLTALNKTQEEGRVDEIISLVEAAEYNQTASPDPNSALFNVTTDSGDIESIIQLRFNKYSGVWKIEGM